MKKILVICAFLLLGVYSINADTVELTFSVADENYKFIEIENKEELKQYKYFVSNEKDLIIYVQESIDFYMDKNYALSMYDISEGRIDLRFENPELPYSVKNVYRMK